MGQRIQNEHLNEVINCLQEQERELVSLKMSTESVPVLYQNAKKVLQTFQNHFNRCKKYNQAKIHRKYEIIISTITEQNKNLKYKIAMQLESRPGSQRYVSDLIDQMIQLKNINEKLTKENTNLKNMVEKLQDHSKKVMSNVAYDEQKNPEDKDLLKKQWEKILIRETADKYFKLKREEALNQIKKQNGNFQKFLIFNQSKLDKWYLLDLFQRVQKWTNNLKDIRFLDKSKIKTRFQRSLTSLQQTNQQQQTEKSRRMNSSTLLPMESEPRTMLKKINIRSIKTQQKEPSFLIRRKPKMAFPTRLNFNNYEENAIATE